MRRKILIFGGTGYFGRYLTEMLLENGDDVTIATRGKSPIINGCNFIPFDRSNDKEFLSGEYFDVVYDQSCYNASFMSNIKKILRDCGKYIFTSSQSVYTYGVDIREDSIDYSDLSIYERRLTEYGVEKLKAEAIVDSIALDYIVVRFPVVVGLSDPRRRIQELLFKIISKARLELPIENPMLHLIEERDAAIALYELGFKGFTGAINIANRNSISVENMCMVLADKLSIDVSRVYLPEYKSTGFDLIKCETKTLNLDKMVELGIPAKSTEDALIGIVEEFGRCNAK